MKQKKYTTRLDIEADIIRYRRIALHQRKLAIGHEIEQKRWWDLANHPETKPHMSDFYRDKGYEEKKLAHRNLTRADRIEQIKMPLLKDALAAFNTECFEFSNDDRSVVIK